MVGTIGGTSFLADIRMSQGRLHDAVELYRRSLKLAARQGEKIIRGTAELHAGLGELYCEQGDFDRAAQHLQKCEALGGQATIIGNEYRRYPTLARAKAALGDLEGALALLDEGERLFYRTPLPNVRPIAAMKVRVWLQEGRVADALDWVHQRGLSVEDEVSYLREYELITLFRVLIARYRTQPETGDLQGGMALLARLLKAAETGGRLGSVIEILVLQAVGYGAIGDRGTASVVLERALTLAEPEGYVRIFLEEGEPIAALLREAAKKGIAPKYVAQLLRAFDRGGGGTAESQLLADPLSERELDVLRLLGTELTGPEIAEELMVSVNTMRTHTKNIYSKLGVNSRRSAVRRAEELNLL